MKVVPRELCISLFVLSGKEDEGRFYLSFIPVKARTRAKALKGRVAFAGCIQRAGSCWEARMATKREKKARSCEKKSPRAKVELSRMPPLAGVSMFILDEVGAAKCR